LPLPEECSYSMRILSIYERRLFKGSEPAEVAKQRRERLLLKRAHLYCRKEGFPSEVTWFRGPDVLRTAWQLAERDSPEQFVLAMKEVEANVGVAMGMVFAAKALGRYFGHYSSKLNTYGFYWTEAAFLLACTDRKKGKPDQLTRIGLRAPNRALLPALYLKER